MKLSTSVWVALCALGLPAAFLVAFVAEQLLVADPDMKFWVLFLVSLTPCGLLAVGLGLFDVFRRRKDGQPILLGKLAAFIIIGVGLLESVGGVFGIGLIVLVLGALD